MRFFQLNGTFYKITLRPGEDWKDCSRDTIERWNPEQEKWLPSDLSVSHVRSFGTPCNCPEPDGWVFIDENDDEIGYAKPNEYHNAEDALNDFGRSAADHFGIMFRRNGELNPCSDETMPEDFYSQAEIEEQIPSSLYEE